MLWGEEFFYEGSRRIARHLRDYFRLKPQYFNHPKFRGHFAVTRSLVEGLQASGASFNYNPRCPSQLADTVVVLAGVRALRQAIKLKQQGRISKLLAGPNIVVFSSDCDSIIASLEIDAIITPSRWVVEMYLEDCPVIKNKIFPWAAGVDTHYWHPSEARHDKKILIFDKRSIGESTSRVSAYVEYLRLSGWSIEVLVRSENHSYTAEQFRSLLHQSCLLVGFTVGSESQGLAWAEAWACDVPTLILKNTSNVYHGRRYACSTAPYLTSQNGLFFDDLEDFKTQFRYWETHRDQFTPRAWTLENMSDEVCAALLYKKVIEC